MNINQIEKQIMKSLSSLLSNVVGDERLKHITILEVKTSKDLDLAKIYFTLFNKDYDKNETLKLLEAKTGFFRKEISQRLNLRKTPKLKFYYDNTYEKANKIEEIIKNIKK